MPYSGAGDEGLPKAVKKLPRDLRELWVRVFNENYDAEDEGQGFKVAWGVIRKVQSVRNAKEWANVDMKDIRAWLSGSKTVPAAPDTPLPVSDGAKATEDSSVGDYPPGQLCPECEADLELPDAGWYKCGGCGAVLCDEASDSDVEDYKLHNAAAAQKLGLGEPPANPPIAKVIKRADEKAENAKAFRSEFKAYAQADGRTRWTLIASGGFQDRDGEIVSTPFLDSAVEYAAKSGDRGPLLIWHIPGSDIGTCDTQVVIGQPGFLLESGLFLDSPRGQRAAKYYRAHAADYGASIQFLWANRAEGVYLPPGCILERSLLPRSKAAFPWSGLHTKELDMGTSKQPRADAVAELAAVLGDDEAKRIVEQLEASAKDLTGLGVRFKEAEVVAEAAPVAPAAEAKAADAPAPEPAVAEEPVANAETKATPEPGLPAPAEISQVEIVFPPATLATMAKAVSDSMGGQFAALTARLATLEGSVQGLLAGLEVLKAADDAKIAEKVAHLPRATVKFMQEPVQRPTQRTPEAGDGTAQKSLADVEHETLYGKPT